MYAYNILKPLYWATIYIRVSLCLAPKEDVEMLRKSFVVGVWSSGASMWP